MATRATTLWSQDKVRNWLMGPASMAAGQEDAIDRIADWASEFLEAETGWKFVTRELDEIYNGDGSRLLRLENGPLISVTGAIVTLLTILRDEDDAAPDTIPATAFEVDKRRRLVRLKTHKDAVDPFTRGFQNVHVKYNVGFGAQDAATLPADVAGAGLDLCSYRWTEYTSGAIAASQISIGPGNIFLKPDFPVSVKKVIGRWSIPVVA